MDENVPVTIKKELTVSAGQSALFNKTPRFFCGLIRQDVSPSNRKDTTIFLVNGQTWNWFLMS